MSVSEEQKRNAKWIGLGLACTATSSFFIWAIDDPDWFTWVGLGAAIGIVVIGVASAFIDWRKENCKRGKG